MFVLQDKVGTERTRKFACKQVSYFILICCNNLFVLRSYT